MSEPLQHESMPAASVTNLGSFAFYAGMVMYTLSDVAPPGFYMLKTGGALEPIADYPGLYAEIGTRYGGDGVTTFGTPPAEWYLAGPSATHPLWSTFGEETHMLTVAELAAHAHPIDVHDPGHAHTTPNVDAFNHAGSSGNVGAPPGSGDRDLVNVNGTGNSVTGITASAENVGGGAAHNNLPPTHRVNVIVKT